jgi:hypothetical protein
MVPTGVLGVLLAEGWLPRLLITTLYLVGALLAGAIVIAAVSRWRRRQDKERSSPGEQLAHFRALYEEGTISAEEFARLRTLLTGQLHATTVGPKPPASAPPESSPSPPGNGQAPEDGIRPA